MINFFTLQNGIRVLVKKIDGFKSVTMGVYVGAGSSYETDSENGISHFIEHMNFKGTSKRTAFELSRDADMLGISLNAATSKEYTYYYAKTISEHTENAFEILQDLFLNSTYPEGELEKERGVVIEEINMYEDTPDDVCTTELSSLFFGSGTGYGKQILGPKDNISRFSRADILNYKEKYYSTDKIVIVFVGDIDNNLAKDLCEKYFGELKSSCQSVPPKRNLTPLFRTGCREKDIEQEHLALAFKGVSVLDDNVDSVSIFINALGGGMSSRLFQKIREELGLCYTIYSYMQSYSDVGGVCVYAGLAQGSTKTAYDAIMQEIRDFSKSGITEQEFLSVREQIKASIIFSQENLLTQMGAYARKLLNSNEVYDFDKRLDKINSLDYNFVNEVMKKVLDVEKHSISIVAKNCIKL